MRIIYLSVLAIFASMSAFASGTWTLQGNAYRADTLFHAYVGPGTTQTSVKLSGPASLRVFYTTTDLTNRNVDARGIKYGDKVVGCGTVSGMAKSHSTATRSYFAGVNADFFGNSAPCGATIIDGEIYNTSPNSSWEQFAIDENKVPIVADETVMNCTLTGSFGTKYIDAINQARYANTLVLYTKRNGADTGTNVYGTEVALVPVASTGLMQGESIKMKVVGSPVAGVGSMTLPEGGFVLSGNGTAESFVSSLTDGQEITFAASVSMDNKTIGKVMQTLGGRPLIVSKGQVLETQGALDHLVSLNPRTAVGYNADKTKLVMLVVDGRSSISAGVVSKVLADMMITTGCSEAMNFDGGGSSVLYIKDLGVRNAPSDGNERSVTNGLFLSTDAPADDVITQICFTDAAKMLPKYGYYTPVFYGYNQYGVLINRDVKGVKLSCDAALGEVKNDGASLLCNGNGCHALTATYNGMATSIPVTIGEAAPSFRLEKAMVDGYNGYSVEVQAMVDDNYMPLDNRALSWWSDDSSIATVDADGVVKGVADGTTKVHGSVGTFEGVMEITVEKPEARVQPIDRNLDPATWTISQVGGTGMTMTALENGMSLKYTGASGRGPYIKLAKKIVIWSLPDTLRMRINPGNANISKITFAAATNTGDVVTTVAENALEANKTNIVDIPIGYICDKDDRSNFPVSLSYIYFNMGTSSTGTEYTIDIPGLEVVYDAVPVSGVAAVTADGIKASIYPNPVTQGENAVVKTSVTGSVTVNIFDTKGMLIMQKNETTVNGVVEVPTSDMGRGLYIVRLETEKGTTDSMKMLVK